MVALHLFDDLDGVLGDFEEGACYRAVFYGPVWGEEGELARFACLRAICECRQLRGSIGVNEGVEVAYQVGPTNMIQFGISGHPRPR